MSLKRKAIVVGAGFSGLAVCYNLLINGWDVDIYDKKPLGLGASGMAAGLVHSFAGEAASKSLEADDAILASNNLFNVAEQILKMPIRTSGGIIRPALTEAQMKAYEKCALKFPLEASWDGSKLWILNGCAINTNLYLKGLWLACKQLGARLYEKKMDHFLPSNIVIWATGADMREHVNVEVTKVRGQLLEVAWPEGIEPLQLPISSKIYVVMTPEGKSCFVGSTYERERQDDIPDVDFARRAILPKIIPLLPFLENMPILNCRAGVRASTPNHRPFAKHIEGNVFAIGGMGSKGLLYHALYAKKLIDLL